MGTTRRYVVSDATDIDECVRKVSCILQRRFYIRGPDPTTSTPLGEKDAGGFWYEDRHSNGPFNGMGCLTEQTEQETEESRKT